MGKRTNWRPVSIFIVIVAIIVLAGLLGTVIYRAVNVNNQVSQGNSGNSLGSHEPKLGFNYRYSDGDTDPAHLIDVLGSEEYYNKLVTSKLLVGYIDIQILSDPGSPPLNIPPTPWVTVVMRGYVTDISPAKRIISITYEGESFSFQLNKNWTQIMLEAGLVSNPNVEFSEIKKGDFLRCVDIFMNSGNLDLPEARSIVIKRVAPTTP